MAHLSSVEARGISKDYGFRRVLSRVALTLRAGEAAVLLGDNGAGKSTLLQILATIVRPSSGSVLYGGLLAGALDQGALRAQVGVLGHEPRCYGDLSARENLLFFGRLYGAGGSVGEVAALLDRLGLAHAADRPVRTYSRGMLQRLAVGRTVLHRPQLLLLDEPYTGLDRGGAALLTTLLLEERARGAMLLIISHDLEAVAPLCDQAVVLRGGRVAAQRRFDGACSGADLVRLYAEAGAQGGDATAAVAPAGGAA